MNKLQSKLAEIKERADKATEGPWVVDDRNPANKLAPGDPSYAWGYSPQYDINTTTGEYFDDNGSDDIKICTNYHRGNSDFIAHARTDVPKLLAVIEKLIEQRDSGGVAGDDYTLGEIAAMDIELLAILEGK